MSQEKKIQKELDMHNVNLTTEKKDLTHAAAPQLAKDPNEWTAYAQEKKQLAIPERLRQLREENARKVKGVFRYYEAPGQTLAFNWGGQYGYNRVDKYVLTDGHMCEVPLGVARHLNKNGAYPVHKNIVDENGLPTVKVSQMTNRFGFQSLEFIDETDFNHDNKIVQANFV